MDGLLAHLRVLDGILEKKVEALGQILNITENQLAVLSSKNQEGAAGLAEGLAGEKLKLIEAVNEGDRVFEKMFREIGERFEPEARGYPELVKSIQERIRGATALDVRIRVMESRGAARPTRAGNAAMMRRAARLYAQNKKPTPDGDA